MSPTATSESVTGRNSTTGRHRAPRTLPERSQTASMKPTTSAKNRVPLST